MRSCSILVAVVTTAGFAAPQQVQQFGPLAGYGLPANTDAGLDVAAGDVDGDGDVDLVFANRLANTIYINDGHGRFTEESSTRLPTRFQVNSQGVEMADMDGDGDLDLVFGNEGQNRLLENNGQGVFSNKPLLVQRASTTGVAVGDIDGDNDLDIVWANTGQNNVWRNDGNLAFTDITASHFPTVSDGSSGLELADIDGDGDLDAIIANAGTSSPGQNRLYTNDGAGHFTDATNRLPQVLSRTTEVIVDDFDSDGDEDIIFLDYLLPSYRCQYLRNEGNLTFTDLRSQFPEVRHQHQDAAAGDIDGDGDLDLVLVYWLVENRIYINDGTGIFTVAPVARGNPAQASSSAVAFADVDGDQDLDIVVANHNAASLIDFNLQRQVHAPMPATVGSNYDIDFYANAGFITTPQPIAGLISLLPVPLPPPIVIPPWGTLYIPPGLAVSFPPITINPASGGKFSVPTSIPNDPRLRGLILYIQAGVIHSNNPSDWRFSNLVIDPIQ